MAKVDFSRAESLIRRLAAARWSQLAIMRSRAEAPWLEPEVDRLYVATIPANLAALSEEESKEWLLNLEELHGLLTTVERAIPFDKKLNPIRKPFRQRFQSIIRLRNAVACGIAGLKERLGRDVRATGVGSAIPEYSFSPDALGTLRVTMLTAIPGWQSAEWSIYEQL